MKMTIKEINSKSYYIVPDGFQVIPPHDYRFETVTKERAVMIKEQIFCTQEWYDDLMKQVGK